MRRRGKKLGVGSVVRGAGAACRDHWRLLLVTAVIVFVPLGLVEALDHRVQELDPDAFTGLEVFAVIAIVFVHAGSALIGEVFYTGVVTAAVAETRTGTRRSLTHLAQTLPYGRLIAVDILYSLAVVVGIVALVVPGILFYTWFALVAPVVEIEDRGVVAAFRRSRELVRGSFWQVFAILVPLELVTDALADAAGALATAMLGDSVLADWLGSALAGVLLTPLYAIAVVVVAHDLIEAEDAADADRDKVAVGTARQEPA